MSVYIYNLSMTILGPLIHIPRISMTYKHMLASEMVAIFFSKLSIFLNSIIAQFEREREGVCVRGVCVRERDRIIFNKQLN